MPRTEQDQRNIAAQFEAAMENEILRAGIDACQHERSAVIDSEPAIDARTGFAVRGFVSEYIECPDCDFVGWFVRAVPEAGF